MAFSQQTITASITHGGLQRDYILYVPANYTGTTAVPLLFNFHGYTSNATEQMWYGDFRAIADTAGFLIVHPEGKLDGSGNTHFNVGWGGSSINDVGFTSALIDSLLLDYSIDEDRVYSTGMSNGGFMSFRLACELSNRIAGIASVTGSIVPQTMTNCAASHTTPIMQFHGTSDATVPYTGGTGWTQPISSLVNYWANFNNCAPVLIESVPNINTVDGSTVEKYSYLNGDNCTDVIHYKITNGGHTWPGTAFSSAGTNQDINASTEIWKFLSRYDINGLRASCSPLSTSILEGKEFQVSPNPSKNVVVVEGEFLSEQSYELFDALGKQVANGQLNNSNNVIDLSKLDSDIYFLKLNNQTIRIVKTND